MKTIGELRIAKMIEKRLNELKSKKVIVGVIGNEVDTPRENGITIKQYAEINEYGTSTIPARPFFRTATKTRDSRAKIQERVEKELRAVIQGKKTPDQALTAIGLFVKGRIQKSIKAGNWVANAPTTIKKKRKKNGTIKPPLIDSGDLIKNIDFQIKNR